MLEVTIRKYQNRTIEAAQVIAELIELAKQMREGNKRGEKLGLTDDEVAFYDALETNDSAVKELGDPILKKIAQELVARVHQSVTIDWTLRETANQLAAPHHEPLGRFRGSKREIPFLFPPAANLFLSGHGMNLC
jgi:type I site-specific restriction-modification system R (restriction) subunit